MTGGRGFSRGDRVDGTEKREENGGRDPGNGRFTSGNTGGGRKPMDPAVKEMLLAATPQAAQRLIDALDAERAVVVPGGKDAGTVEKVPDFDMRIKAANSILDRVYGKPTVAITGEDGGPLKIEASAGFLEALKRLGG